MSCDFGSSSPYQESIFEEDWNKCIGSDMEGLEAIAEYNNSPFDVVKIDNGTSIDPQLLSNPFSPINSTGPALNNATSDIDQGFDPPVTLNNYPDFTQPPSAATPYFQSIELAATSTGPEFRQPSPHHSQLHRRSLSAPPDGLVAHHYLHHHPNGPPVTLHRDGHFLGAPKSQYHEMTRLKSLPKNRQNRHQPYSFQANKRGHERHQLRRTQTQPIRAGPPTSVPIGMSATLDHNVIQQRQQMPPPPPQPHYVSSRVCTPVASPTGSTMRGHLGSSMPIDPVLQSPKAEGEGGSKTVAIPLAVDELRAMITEAVQKAVMGVQAGWQKQEEIQQDSLPDAEVMHRVEALEETK